jgi:PIN domain nuclease of toxin-antitoxin system
VTILLDTHFLIWIVLRSRRARKFAWLGKYLPWGVSPVSLLEIQFLSEARKLEVRNPEFVDALLQDSRFVIDEAPLLPLVRHSLSVTWTRDPFDRLLSAHSSLRRVPLCTLDSNIQSNHSMIVAEARAERRRRTASQRGGPSSKRGRPR